MLKEVSNYITNLLFKKSNKIYRNADFYNMLGQEYVKIMEFAYGKCWEYVNVRERYDLINSNLGTSFDEKDSLEFVLYKVKMLYYNKEVVEWKRGF